MKRIRTKNNESESGTEKPIIKYDESGEGFPVSMQNVVQKGVRDTELGIFNNCSFIRERLENLSNIVRMLEKDLCKESSYSHLEPDQKLKLYTIYSSISMQMLEFLKDVHGLIADEVKFKRIQDLIAEAKNSLNKETPRVMSPKMRQILDAVRDAVGGR